MPLSIPDLSLVLLIGASGAGKSTFAQRHFRPTEIISSDFCRALVSDDENDQSATKAAFELLRFIAAKRLEGGRLTVIDATNVQAEARRPLVALAREYHVFPVAIVFDLPERIAQERNAARPDRAFGAHVVRRHTQELRRSLRGLRREGFRYVHVLDSVEAVEAATIERTPLWTDRRYDHGPFDIIGDIHGCYDELVALLGTLGYRVEGEGEHVMVEPPSGRRALFLGDLVDRGPKSPAVLRLVMGMVAAGTALALPGNHDVKLVRALRGKQVKLTHGLDATIAQLADESSDFREAVATFLDGLISHYVLDEGRLVVAHAGMKEAMQGRSSGAVRDFALYGETTGETDEFGLPVRYPWAQDYRGQAMVVYGHTPVPEAEWLNRTINIDTGCVFGGQLTALRYPERELVSVPARERYAEPARPFLAPPEAPALSAQQQHDDLLDLSDFTGKRFLSTPLFRNIVVQEENAAAALEVMGRAAVNPKWLIYLPPTMSPSETSTQPGLLEHPAEAFAYYRGQGIGTVVCEEKHMGSRAVVVVCRDEAAARARFGLADQGAGICFTRTGRRFFTDPALERAFIERVQGAVSAAGLWETLQSDWLCLDCELMPWSAKAMELVRGQYAAVGAAARGALAAALPVVAQGAARLPELEPLLARTRARAKMAERYAEAYRRYCWPTPSLDDFRLAPFHLLASEGAVHHDKDHRWHLEMVARLATDDPLLMKTAHRFIDLADPASEAEGIAWWEQLTVAGGEGMVVKPLPFLARGPRGLIQPAIKCRGPEYLRLIYGPEYSAPDQIEALRARGLGRKRALALREFALGLEALERFVRREPLYRIHECVFALLALESEPIDPRL